MDEARASGKEMRNINLVRLRGVNHFVSNTIVYKMLRKEFTHWSIQAHWDLPEKTLAAFLENTKTLASSELYSIDF